MKVRFYGGTLHGQLREVPDSVRWVNSAEDLPFFPTTAKGWPKDVLTTKTRRYVAIPHETGLLANEDNEVVFRLEP